MLQLHPKRVCPCWVRQDLLQLAFPPSIPTLSSYQTMDPTIDPTDSFRVCHKGAIAPGPNLAIWLSSSYTEEQDMS